jgi:type I restriction enzyme M protein
MRQKPQTRQTGAAKAIKDIRRATRKQYSAEEKIRIVLDGFVVTNGCHRLRIKNGSSKLLPHLLAFLCSEAYAVQMRALARGSDGLAEITADDLKHVLIPKLSKNEVKAITPFVEALIAGSPDINGKVASIQSEGTSQIPAIMTRQSHVILV